MFLCKYKIQLIMKKYSKGKNYFSLDLKSFEKDDIDEINFWRRTGFVTPVIVFIIALVVTLIFK